MINKKPNPYNHSCPSREVLTLISSKWAVLILCVLHEKATRTGELKRKIDGISQKMLTQTLKKMEQNGIVKRISHPEVPPRVEYELTSMGQSISELVLLMENWVVENYQRILKARKLYEKKLEQ